ncbi:MAG: cholesterol oxidase [Myxococcota bacterium]|jgi:cholesterol oxidase
MGRMQHDHYDWIIVGSGFGGAVSALRLVEKGYRVLVLEKGRRWRPEDFPRSTWDVRRFLWQPEVGLRGPFKMTFFRHLTVYSGVGVGGGSLVYANTLPVPKQGFFTHGSWAGLADWQAELAPHYATAQRMLGAATNPRLTAPDHALQRVAEGIGRADAFHPTEVAVFFGDATTEVPDPYFDGEGPPRVGCSFCGACMTGCRHGAKNTLDKNYLYLAERRGLELAAEQTVQAVRAREQGYEVETVDTFGWQRRRQTLTADRVMLSGGVLGTVDLLLRMRAAPDGLPALSGQVGQQVRTNSEALIGVTTSRPELDLSEGIAISSILHTDAHSHLEPVRYAAGSGLFRLLVVPHAPGATLGQRLAATLRVTLTNPLQMLKTWFVRDWAKSTTILLYMRSLEGTLALERGWFGMRTHLSTGATPTAAIPEASALAEAFAAEVDGTTVSIFSETILGTPSTAHILGGACIGADPTTGVIGPDHQVHGYPGLYVCDGSAVSANPGVNPSLTITAMTERAMAGIAPA